MICNESAYLGGEEYRVEKTCLPNEKQAAVRRGGAGGGEETESRTRQLLAPSYVDLPLPARFDLLGSQNPMTITFSYRSSPSMSSFWATFAFPIITQTPHSAAWQNFYT